MTAAVSVLIPVYNASAFLRETLRSALSQEVDGGVEVIVLDDGSLDDSVAIASSFAPLVRVHTQANAGASATRNRLTAMAAGEFVQYLDADDLLPDGAIAARVAALKASGADVAYSDWQRLDPDSHGGHAASRVERRDFGPTPETAALAMFRGAWSPPVAWTFRRSVIARMPPWREDLPVIQDARFTLDAALSGATFVRVAEIGGLYRTGRADSLSRRDFPAFLADCLRNSESVREELAARDALSAEWRDALAEACNYVARSAFSLAPDTAARAWAELLRAKPSRVPLWPRLAFGMARVLGYRGASRVMALLDRIPRP